MNIVSLLPSTTEIVYALGLGGQLRGVTHECDFPEGGNGRVPSNVSTVQDRPAWIAGSMRSET